MDALVKWWFVFWSCVVGALFVQYNGLFDALWHADHLKLSYVILAIFFVTTVFTGVLIRRVAKLGLSAVKAIKLDLPMCWYSTEAMNALGMIGTVGGFLIMLTSAFSGPIDPANAEAMKRLISSAAIGLSTSACATLVGLLCSSIAKLQLVILEKAIDKAEDTPQEPTPVEVEEGIK